MTSPQIIAAQPISERISGNRPAKERAELGGMLRVIP